jgi:hypothetical protein
MVPTWEALDELVFSAALASWLVLWFFGFRTHDADNRFRCLSIGTLALYIVLGEICASIGLSWGGATAIWFLGLWIFAILGSAGSSSLGED